MNKFYQILYSLLIVFVLGIISCSDCPDPKQEPQPQQCDLTQHSNECAPLRFDIKADEKLSEGYKLAILAAINEWSERTGFNIEYTLEFKDMSKEPKDLSHKHSIRIYLQDPGPGLVGWTEWVLENQSANILMEPNMDYNYFRIVMLHELGHAFDLRFDNNDIHYNGTEPSIMYPSVGSEPQHLGCPELKSFCGRYSCDTNCN